MKINVAKAFIERLDEAKVFIQVTDPKDAIAALKKAGVRATPDKKMDDEIVVDSKDKKKVVAWMLKSGWEKQDIEDLYPKLMEDNTNDVSDDGDEMDKVQPKALKKKFKDRKDKDIDNDGKVDDSDEYLHNRRKAVSKAVKEETVTEATDLYDKGGIQMTRFSMGKGAMGLQINYGGKYIQVPEKDIKTLAGALSKLKFRQGM
jgi:hypothetical protein